ncbi:hypothetical protein P153DRAFT_355654 [Dothidotthia symphoricarpi CBS 119687]|uniref:Uncharacterized protein n=1 Tax=Dothidotthia symphoricarpi CBS 119687 TaxID=1392245 RepID=A0A6A6AFT1_9PLEO|nr:uncharacterized protein P153DRAFT_355654 [Dothidotthia symphoricarpi CBS 119687]KAF2130832.1 hypothetical protein P153DRAFT_355654 [Dothidotthia symphoricarpi CBS 119687]
MKLLQIALSGLMCMTALAAVDLPVWRNIPGRSFHCDPKNNAVVSCRVDDTCNLVKKCSDYNLSLQCLDNGMAVSCAETQLGGIDEVAMAGIKARVAVPQENKKYICSSDRASILICRYGFCSTDKYCKKGAECWDDCTCCKGKHTRRDVNKAIETGGVIPVKSVGRNLDDEVYECDSNTCDHDLKRSAPEDFLSTAEAVPE